MGAASFNHCVGGDVRVPVVLVVLRVIDEWRRWEELPLPGLGLAVGCV
jgi:hypothetical protein